MDTAPLRLEFVKGSIIVECNIALIVLTRGRRANVIDCAACKGKVDHSLPINPTTRDVMDVQGRERSVLSVGERDASRRGVLNRAAGTIVGVRAIPTTVKLPLVLVSTMPFAPPLAETLVSDMISGVVPLPRVISTAMTPLVLIAPPVDVSVMLLSVASSPR